MKHYWKLYFFLVPSVLLVAVFSYYPAVSAMYHSFFRWNGDDMNYYVGMQNFRSLLGIIFPWILVFIAFYAVILYAKEDSSRATVVRVAASVLSMIITAGVLAFNGFAFEVKPTDKLLTINLVNASAVLGTGLIVWGSILLFVQYFVSDENDRKWIYLSVPAGFIAASFMRAIGFSEIFSYSFIMLVAGIIIWFIPAMENLKTIDGARTFHAFTALSISFWALGAYGGGDRIMWGGFSVLAILIAFNIVKMVPSIITAVVVHRIKNDTMNYWYRVLFVIPMIIPGMVYLLIWKFFFNPNEGIFNRVLIYTKVMDVLVYLDGILGWGGLFKEGVMPVWLGNEHLVLPALILWGFPWVGVVGVLIYLAGLQGIDASVYEAADLDGASPIQKFTHIELPLIMTQVRINLVLMVIGTLQAYAHILILFDIDGGPNGKLMIPGLYMFREAFRSGNAGYACAIGLVIFFLILILTELNNRYIRVEK